MRLLPRLSSALSKRRVRWERVACSPLDLRSRRKTELIDFADVSLKLGIIIVIALSSYTIIRQAVRDGMHDHDRDKEIEEIEETKQYK